MDGDGMTETLKVKATLLTTAQIEGAWPAVKHMIEDALEHGTGRMDADDVLSLLKSGGMGLWVIINEEGTPEVLAALVTEMVDYPQKRVLDLSLMGGRRADLWLHILPQLETFAASAGCQQVQIHGRAGWGRVTGYPETARVFVKEVSDG